METKTKGSHRTERRGNSPQPCLRSSSVGFWGASRRTTPSSSRYPITLPGGRDSGEKEGLDTTGSTKSRALGLSKVCPIPNPAWQCPGVGCSSPGICQNPKQSTAGMCPRDRGHALTLPHPPGRVQIHPTPEEPPFPPGCGAGVILCSPGCPGEELGHPQPQRPKLRL